MPSRRPGAARSHVSRGHLLGEPPAWAGSAPLTRVIALWEVDGMARSRPRPNRSRFYSPGHPGDLPSGERPLWTMGGSAACRCGPLAGGSSAGRLCRPRAPGLRGAPGAGGPLGASAKRRGRIRAERPAWAWTTSGPREGAALMEKRNYERAPRNRWSRRTVPLVDGDGTSQGFEG